MNKQAAIYARVSTDDQAERGYSLPSQVEGCQNFAGQRVFDVAAIYQDDISGAKPISLRPEGEELQRAIDAGLIRVVIVYCVDRLSRDIVDLLTTVRDWLHAGVEIYALDIGQVTSELDIVLVIKGWQGSDERQKIRERTMRGREAKAKSGKVIGAGLPPYGYTYLNGELVIEESQARIVSLIFNWYVNGDENGRMMSLLKIAARLADMRIPSPTVLRKMAGKRVRTGNWRLDLIRRIITSETYCGAWRYGKQKGKAGRGGARPSDEQIIVSVPAIVSRETWELAQKKRAYNIKMSTRKMKREYLLRGLIYCGCGRAMVGGGGRDDLYYYYCPRKHSSGVAFGRDVCNAPLVRTRKVEYVTWGYVMSLLTNAEEFEEKLREAQAIEAEQMQPKQKELEHVIAMITDTEYEAEQVAETLKNVRGIINAKLKAQADEIDRRYQVLQARKAKLESEFDVELTDETIENLIQFRETVAIGLNNPTPEERRLWLELLQTRVTVSHGIAVVTCRLSGEAVSFELSTAYQTSQGKV